MGEHPAEPRAVAPVPQVQGWSAIVLAVLMLVAWAFPSLWPATFHEYLEKALQTEAVVLLIFFLPLLLLGGMPAVPRMFDKVVYWTYGIGYLGLLAVLAVYTRGLFTSVEAAVLTFVTYGGLLWRPPTRAVVTIYLFRLIFSFLLLFALMVLIIGLAQEVFGQIQFVNLLTGAVFFATLGVMDVRNSFGHFVERLEARQRRAR